MINTPHYSGDLITEDGRTSQYVVIGFTDTDIVHMDVQDIQVAETAYMLIDLSDMTNWPHSETGHINIEYAAIEIDPTDAFVGEIKFGFLTDVDANDGNFHQVLDLDMRRKAGLLVEVLDFGSHGMDLELANWFGPTTANSALFRTGVNLLGPDGATAYPSGAGDLVMIVQRTAGSVDVSITIGYETVT